MVIVSAPGKLMLSGEWSVLEKGIPCIVLAVQQRVFASIESAKEYSISLNNFNIETKAFLKDNAVKFENDDPALIFTKIAMETTFQYLTERNISLKPFHLSTSAEITSIKDKNGKEMKVGFGSSAAAVVAITGAILHFHEDVKFENDIKSIIFKLAIIAHYYGQGKLGSGFDVAASSFGGALVYKRFDSDWLQEELRKNSLLKVINKEWPLLEHRNLILPKELDLMVGFTGTSASTRKLVQQMRVFKAENLEYYWEIINSIKRVTEHLVIEFATEANFKKILTLLDENRLLLEELSLACFCELEIKEHQIMSQIALFYGTVAKFSGAGGGDCSIGVSFSRRATEMVLKEWKARGIIPIDIGISQDGIRLENSRNERFPSN